MKISTRGRYAIRFMIDLAEQNKGDFVPLKDTAVRQEISQKYLESIAKELSKAKLIIAQHGKGGGYKLSRQPSYYNIGEILCVTEGNLAPVSCLEQNALSCPRSTTCKTLNMWKGLYSLINDYFSKISLADLVGTKLPDNWII